MTSRTSLSVHIQNFFLYIPYVNRYDLLLEAYASVKDVFQHIIVIDNSPARELEHINPEELPNVITPEVPLTFSQTQNLMLELASNNGHPFFFFMHNDARAGEGTAQKLLNAVELCDKNWGAIFANYDTLCAYNTKSCLMTGLWDTNFPQYYSDCDYYYRLKLNGYEVIELGLPVEHNGKSNTMKADPKRQFLNIQTFALYQVLYCKKWGGDRNLELYKDPYNRPDLFNTNSI